MVLEPLLCAGAVSVGGSRLGRVLVLGLLLLVVGLGVRHFLRPVQVEADWSFQFEAIGTPVDVYLGDTRIGTTPFTFRVGPDDARVISEVGFDPLGTHSASTFLAPLDPDLVALGEPDALAPGTAHGGLAGVVLLGTDPEGSISLRWWNTIARRPDGSLDAIYPVIVENELDGQTYGFILRFRRGDEIALNARFGQGAYPRQRWRRLLTRQVSHTFRAVVTLDAGHDLEELSEQFEADSWWLHHFPPGADRLVAPGPSGESSEEGNPR